VEPGRGIRLKKKIGDDLQRETSVAVRQACLDITSANRARIKSVTAEATSYGLVQITISYDDLTLGTEGILVI
jgi:hypothetical protein